MSDERNNIFGGAEVGGSAPVVEAGEEWMTDSRAALWRTRALEAEKMSRERGDALRGLSEWLRRCPQCGTIKDDHFPTCYLRLATATAGGVS